MKQKIGIIAAFLLATVTVFAIPSAEALECGFITRDNCDEVCAGKTVIGCRNCGFLCEECECGPPPTVEKVCCHVKGADCNTEVVPDAAAWMSAEECDRVWMGIGEKTCPPEACGPQQ